MRPTIQFINFTTTRPFTNDDRAFFYETAYPHFRSRLDGCWWKGEASHWIDVYFVWEGDEDLDRESKDDGDWLGVYLSSWAPLRLDGTIQGRSHRVIKVSPEKIYDAARKDDHNYRVLLTKVIIHELAHWLMDPGLDYRRACRGTPEWLLEESLANATALAQYWSMEDRKWLRKFCKSQPKGYKHALHWKGTPTEVFDLSQQFRVYKTMPHSQKDDVLENAWTALQACPSVSCANTREKWAESVYIYDRLTNHSELGTVDPLDNI